MGEETKGLIEVVDQTERFKEFFEEYEKNNLLSRSNKQVVLVDFSHLSSFDPKLALEVLDYPEESLKAAEVSLKQIELPSSCDLKVRFFNLPNSHRVKISDLRTEHLKKFVSVEGVIRQKSPSRPKTLSIEFECPSCDKIFNVVQNEEIISSPKSCSCGRKGSFRIVDKVQVDFQGLKVEEPIKEVISGTKGERINIFLESDLALPEEQHKYVPGSKIVVNGIFVEVPKWKKRGGKEGQSTTSETMIIASSVEQVESLFENIKTDGETEKKIVDVSKNPKLFELMLNAVAPTIFGYDDIKLAMTLQMAGGNRISNKNDVDRRGDIHILLVGDPGSGKSILLQRANSLHPKSRLVSATTATGVGITAAVVKDEFLGGYCFEAGAIVLANRGLLCLDEIGTMSPEDLAKLQEALEHGRISLDKGNVHETLPAETSVLAAGNPKHGRFDTYGDISEQIGLPAPIMSRFDIVYPFKDSDITEKDDRAIAKQIIKLHKKAVETTTDYDDSTNPFLDVDFFRSYVAFAKRITPMLSDEADQFLEEHYVKLRNMSRNNQKMKGVQAREIEGMIRLAEASAKLRLSSVVSAEDIKRAIDLKDVCWRKIGFDPNTGVVDMDKIYTGIVSSEREKMQVIKEIVYAQKSILVEEAQKLAAERGVSEFDFEKLVEKLKRIGELFEPRYGTLQRLD